MTIFPRMVILYPALPQLPPLLFLVLVKLKLSREHSGYLFDNNMGNIMACLKKHSGGACSFAVDLIMKSHEQLTGGEFSSSMFLDAWWVSCFLHHDYPLFLFVLLRGAAHCMISATWPSGRYCSISIFEKRSTILFNQLCTVHFYNHVHIIFYRFYDELKCVWVWSSVWWILENV